MRYAILIVGVAALLALGGFMVAVDRLERALLEPAPGPTVERVVILPEDAALPAVLDELAGAGLVADEGWLHTYADRLAEPRRLVAGEYALSSEMSPMLQLERLARGEVMMHAVNLEPGWTAAKMARALAREGLGDLDALEAAVADETVCVKLGVDAPTLEGFLMPEVYTMPKGLPVEEVLGVIHKRFEAFLAEHPNASGRALFDVVRVASLVQLSDVPRREWRVYAALVYNRLDAKIPLDHPRTAAYGRGLGREGRDNPYRTDRRPGLPPTPICNPGPEALMAALDPARTDALYMAQREDGSHFYCPDLECKRAAERARKGLPPVLPPPLPPPAPVVAPPPPPVAEPLVVPGRPLEPEPPSEIEPPPEAPDPTDGEQPL